MAKADAETWAFWAPLVYGVICVLVGFLVHGVVFPLIERGMYAASKRLDPLAWPTLVIFMDEIVAHRILVAVSRCILVSSIFGAVVLMNLGRDETHFGGASTLLPRQNITPPKISPPRPPRPRRRPPRTRRDPLDPPSPSPSPPRTRLPHRQAPGSNSSSTPRWSSCVSSSSSAWWT